MWNFNDKVFDSVDGILEFVKSDKFENYVKEEIPKAKSQEYTHNLFYIEEIESEVHTSLSVYATEPEWKTLFSYRIHKPSGDVDPTKEQEQNMILLKKITDSIDDRMFNMNIGYHPLQKLPQNPNENNVPW